MPIYEYRCASCGHELETLQRLSDPPLTVCPSCQRADLRKRVSAAGFQLKGSGWYVTDFRNSGAKPAAKAAAGKAGNGADTKTKSDGAGEATAATSSQPSDASSESKTTVSTKTDA